MKTVYASEGGSRFHAATNCRALRDGQELYGGWGTLRIHAVRETTIADAMGRGKEACSLCFPGLRAAWYRGSSENDYGHWPTRGISLNSLADDVCQRCTEWGVWYGDANSLRPVHITWPCTSALILGLVPREVVA